MQHVAFSLMIDFFVVDYLGAKTLKDTHYALENICPILKGYRKN